MLVVSVGCCLVLVVVLCLSCAVFVCVVNCAVCRVLFALFCVACIMYDVCCSLFGVWCLLRCYVLSVGSWFLVGVVCSLRLVCCLLAVV